MPLSHSLPQASRRVGVRRANEPSVRRRRALVDGAIGLAFELGTIDVQLPQAECHSLATRSAATAVLGHVVSPLCLRTLTSDCLFRSCLRTVHGHSQQIARQASCALQSPVAVAVRPHSAQLMCTRPVSSRVAYNLWQRLDIGTGVRQSAPWELCSEAACIARSHCIGGAQRGCMTSFAQRPARRGALAPQPCLRCAGRLLRRVWCVFSTTVSLTHCQAQSVHIPIRALPCGCWSLWVPCSGSLNSASEAVNLFSTCCTSLPLLVHRC